MRFERHASQVVFDESAHTFVVTWTKCGVPLAERIAARRDPLVWIPSVLAMATLYDRGCVPSSQNVYAAMAVGRAWDAGDRDMLDTEGAKKAAELVRDLASMCVDMESIAVSRDVGQAMRHLLDEIAAVRFMCLAPEDLSEEAVIPTLKKSVAECLETPGFRSWPAQSMRRRFLFCLNRKERTQVAYTLASLMFDVGSCPLLSLSDRRALRRVAASESGLDISMSPDSMVSFFRIALCKMRESKARGESALWGRTTKNQLADSVLNEVGNTEKHENRKGTVK